MNRPAPMFTGVRAPDLVAGLAAGFRDWDTRSGGGGDRDERFAQFVLNVLADVHEPGTSEALDLIDAWRAVTR